VLYTHVAHNRRQPLERLINVVSLLPPPWMETRSCLWKLFTDHSGFMVVALEKVPIINRTSSRQGGRKRGSQVHPCPVAVKDVHGFL